MKNETFQSWWDKKKALYPDELEFFDSIIPDFTKRLAMAAWYDGRAEHAFEQIENRIKNHGKEKT